MDVVVQCVNPDEIKLRVTVEMQLRQWKEVIRMYHTAVLNSDDRKYYNPLRDVIHELERGIYAIENREVIRPKEPTE